MDLVNEEVYEIRLPHLLRKVALDAMHEARHRCACPIHMAQLMGAILLLEQAERAEEE